MGSMKWTRKSKWFRGLCTNELEPEQSTTLGNNNVCTACVNPYYSDVESDCDNYLLKDPKGTYVLRVPGGQFAVSVDYGQLPQQKKSDTVGATISNQSFLYMPPNTRGFIVGKNFFGFTVANGYASSVRSMIPYFPVQMIQMESCPQINHRITPRDVGNICRSDELTSRSRTSPFTFTEENPLPVIEPGWESFNVTTKRHPAKVHIGPGPLANEGFEHATYGIYVNSVSSADKLGTGWHIEIGCRKNTLEKKGDDYWIAVVARLSQVAWGAGATANVTDIERFGETFNGIATFENLVSASFRAATTSRDMPVPYVSGTGKLNLPSTLDITVIYTTDFMTREEYIATDTYTLKKQTPQAQVDPLIEISNPPYKTAPIPQPSSVVGGNLPDTIVVNMERIN